MASATIVIILALKTNAFEFISEILKIKGKKNNLKENSDESKSPTIQANANKDSNINFGNGTQIIYSNSAIKSNNLEKPDIIIKSFVGIIKHPVFGMSEVITIEIQNRSTQIVYLGNIFFKQSNDQIAIPEADCITREYQKRKVLNPGEKLSFNVDPEKLVNSAIPNKIINVAIRDEIERIYEGDEEELKVNLEVLLSLRKERKNR